MFPYRVKYTESEYDIQNSVLLCKIKLTCTNIFEMLERKVRIRKSSNVSNFYIVIYIISIIHTSFFWNVGNFVYFIYTRVGPLHWLKRIIDLMLADCTSPNKRSFRAPGGVGRGLDLQPSQNLCAGTGVCGLQGSPGVSRGLPHFIYRKLDSSNGGRGSGHISNSASYHTFYSLPKLKNGRGGGRYFNLASYQYNSLFKYVY